MTQQKRVTTQYGTGLIVASETQRGSTSYKVEGEGFSIWLTAAQIPEFGQMEWDDYRPDRVNYENSTTLPYNPRPQVLPHNGESTIQPNQSIDPEKRTTPADSVTFEERERVDRFPNNFATASRHEAVEETFQYPSQMIDEEYPGGLNTPADHSLEQLNADLHEVQARLGDKYIDIPMNVDMHSLQARLDDDPYRVVSDIKMANFETREGLDDRVAASMDLEAADPQIREAAWADVRAKATRLRRSGAVQLEAANPTAIVATVTGDHGVYQVAVLRGSAMTGSSSVSEWTCSCPWGDWAFERERTFVGRLCSHAYAALQELRSLTMRKDNHPRDWSHSASTKTADLSEDLSNGKWVDVTDSGVATIYSADGEVLDTIRGMDVRDALRKAKEATSPGGRLFRSDAHEATQYPNLDGTLTTEPGTLTPDMMFVPPAAGNEHHQEDVQVGTPYPQPIVAAVDPVTLEEWTNWSSQHPGGTIEEFENEWPQLPEDLEDLRTHVGFLSEPFAGSGPAPKDNWTSSEEYVENHERPHHQDINEDRGNPVQPNGDDARVAEREDTATNYFANYYGQETAADRLAAADRAAQVPDIGVNSDGTPIANEIDVESPEEEDIVAKFQREAGAHLMSDNGGSGGGGDFDFAASAKAFLRTAGRNFTFAEQQALMEEAAIDGPIDQADLDLRGTHYLP